MKKSILALTFSLALLLPVAGCSDKNTYREEDIIEESDYDDIAVDGEEGDGEIVTQNSEGGEYDGQSADTAQTANAAVYASYLKVTADNVNIRSGAGTGYSILGTAEKDTFYALCGEAEGWYKINYLNGSAYISKCYVTAYDIGASDSAAIESVISEGTKLLGTPYVYGAVRYHDGKGNLNSGFTANEFDCSSLTQYIFYKGADGLLLDVTTRTQILQGTTVQKAGIKRGDLLFFTNSSRYNNSGIERVGHVALYLGNNLILHTSSDYAKIEEISSTRWSYFIQAQRML